MMSMLTNKHIVLLIYHYHSQPQPQPQHLLNENGNGTAFIKIYRLCDPGSGLEK
jgi:hypothetical protein